MAQEQAAETVYVRGEGGGIFEMSLPFSESIQDRVDKGYLRVVANEDGDPLPDPDEAPTTAPAKSANKGEWHAWAVAQGMSPDDADAATKQDLIDKYGN